ncbi:unnamed protein product [Mesocestoides corti]|uniref:DUF3421 domain-containing protein n=2 Tax=Mesocestoides corti TaxID=53468 RepID=A0A158QVZ2_MESCO|nr:unnamed protein product [Mesocestoides corti]
MWDSPSPVYSKPEMSKVGRGFQVGLSWVPVKDSEVPRGAIETQQGIYVARGEFNGEIIPGKYVAKYRICYVPRGGDEIELHECEVLCDTSLTRDYQWVGDSNGDVPKNAIVGGIAGDGEPLYVCRQEIEDEMCAGKIHNGHGCAYIPYGGKEHSVEQYEVLVYQWVGDSKGNVPKNAIVGGIVGDGAPLYVCKQKIEDEMCAGKVHNGHGFAYIPYGGKEHPVEQYQVLVLRE